MVTFDIQPVSSSIIMVVGVGGGGSNAVNHMYRLGIADVSFMVCNTDRQALSRSPIYNKVTLGQTLTGGLGAGNKPECGRAAAEESIEEVKEAFRENNIKMVFITAGMGGGTGTGAAPVIARAAKEMGILTVAIVTIPFVNEGQRRVIQALEGIEAIRDNVDSLLVINNENINDIYGDLPLSEAFGKADDILATAAKSIAEIITRENKINVDFADVQTVMKDSGIALMGSARGNGPDRALEVAEAAIASPLLNHRDISGARNVLLNITSGSGQEVTLAETYKITQFVQERTRNNNATDLIWGAGIDEALGDDIQITVIATGFDTLPNPDTFGGGATDGGKDVVPLFEEDTPAKAPKGPVASDDFSVVTHTVPETTPAPRSTYNTQPASYTATPPQPTPCPLPEVTQRVEEEVAVAMPAPAEAIPQIEPPLATYEESAPLALTALSDEKLEELVNIPAYIRRKMKIENDTLPEGGKISRETLKNDPWDAPKEPKGPKKGSGGDLFN